MGWLWSRLPLSTPNWQMDVEFKVGRAFFRLELITARSTAKLRTCSVMGLQSGSQQTEPSLDQSLAASVSSYSPSRALAAILIQIDYFKGLGIFFDT